MISSSKIIILAQTVLIIFFLILFVFHIHITTKHGPNKNELLALSTRYDPDETRASVISFEPLRDSIVGYLAENNLDAAVYVVNLRNGVSFGINENEGAFPASLNKVPVAILIMREAERGKFKLSSMVPVNATILQSNSAEVYTNNAGIRVVPDSGEVYKNNKELQLHVLLENMLQKSDNNALRMLSTQINKKDLLSYYNYIDVDAYGSYDYATAGANNRRLSAKSLANIFLSLYYSTILEPKDSQYILSLLTDTTFDMRKVAQLPENVKVAHKFGVYNSEKEYLFRDCGIIYSGKSRILYCVIIRAAQGEAISVAGSLIKATHDYVINNEITLEDYGRRDNKNN